MEAPVLRVIFCQSLKKMNSKSLHLEFLSSFRQEYDTTLKNWLYNYGSKHTLLNLKQELMENLVGLGTQEIERVMVLAVTNRPFDLDEAIITKFPHRFYAFKFGAESLCGTVAAANSPLRELLEEEKKTSASRSTESKSMVRLLPWNDQLYGAGGRLWTASVEGPLQFAQEVLSTLFFLSAIFAFTLIPPHSELHR
ncbi:hypothetical protein AAG906_023167 [Vitis piasezkii]